MTLEQTGRHLCFDLLLLLLGALLLLSSGCSVSGDGEVNLNQKIQYEEMPFPIYDY